MPAVNAAPALCRWVSRLRFSTVAGSATVAAVGAVLLGGLRAAPPVQGPGTLPPGTMSTFGAPAGMPQPGQGLPPGAPSSLPQGQPPSAPNSGSPGAPLSMPGGGLRDPSPYAGALSNPLLSPSPWASTPQQNEASRDKVAKYVARLIDPETTLDLVVGQTRNLVLKQAPFRVQAGNDQTIGFNPARPLELMLQGKQVGATILTLWFGDKNDPTKQETLTYLVRVFPDPEAKERLERAYKALEDDINRYFRDTSVRLTVLGDKLLVSGRARDFVQANQILRIIRASTNKGGNNSDAAKAPLAPADVEGPHSPTTPPPLDAFQNAGGPNVINMLEIAGEQQVLLRVIVAEVNRAAARSVGMNFSVINNQGVTVFANTTGGLGGYGGFGGGIGGGGGLGVGGNGITNIFASFDAGKVPVAISSLKSLQYAKSLAEPTLVTLNGATANFLAGGEFPVPVIAAGGYGGGYGYSNLAGVSYVPYGVQLNFTPFITDRDRIRLVLNANVSTRDLDTSTNIGGSSVAGLNTRCVNTTVELRQGETLAVAGLIETDLAGNKSNLPFIGDIPFINNLTGLQQVQANEKELVIFVTPELTRPIDPNQAIPLPGREILDPNDVELYLMGRIEGHCRDFRSAIRDDCSRIRMYARTEETNVSGPSGYTPLP